MGSKVLSLLREEWVIILFLVLVLGAYMLLRTRQTVSVSAEELFASLEQGQPTVLEFYSNG